MSVVSSPAKATVGTDPNPLLIGHGLPPFSDIQPGDVVPGIEQLLETLGNELSALEEQLKHKLEALPTTALTWSDLIEPLTALTERLSWSWGIIGHLMGVKNSPELRAAYESVQPALVEFSNRIGQSQVIYTALGKIKAGKSWSDLEPAQKRIVEAALQDAELSGVGLSGEQKETFNDIQRQLADLSTQFSNHVLDATKAFSLTLTQPEEVAGLPPSLLSLAAQAARDAAEQAPEGADEVELGKKATAETGPWRITLDMPSYIPFLRHAQRRDLREQLYRAFITRASVGELDNAPLIEKILALRSQKAHLLGFKNYAELSLAKKMAPSVSAVEKLMEELRSASYDAAHRELEEIKAFASQQTSTSTETAPVETESIEIKQWDVPFWTERMREQQFDLSDEALKPYFPLPNVLEGLFGLAERLFGITIADADQEAPVWHPDVRYFQVSDATTQETIAHFYLDPYSRPAEKRGGAWMDECIVRAKVQSPENNSAQIRLPVAYLVCNQSPPIDGKPSLMTFREVETLFHEFGHGLQHMLTAVDYPGAAGINNVEWDAVELPSQFMENWCYDRDTLFGMAQHYETGEPLPEADYQKLLAARHFMTGNAILRQVNFGWTDMALHADYRPEGTETVWEVRDRIAQKATIMPPLPEDAFLCSFGHIFSGGYAAGYYSYFWAEVLSADAFSAFEEAGLEDKEQVSAIGRRFRDTVLALGGSHHPMEVFKAFRGREPSTQALLRHRGLAGNGASHTPNNRGKKAA